MKSTIKDLKLENKRVLIRCDFNVPMKDGKIMDDTRIQESVKTIQYAVDHQAKIILFSHLGRVTETRDLEKNSLEPISIRLTELLNQPVLFCQETRGSQLETMIKKMKSGEILLVQNTRYEDVDGKKESSNDNELGKYWASLGDIFINDAFGTIHRAHASTVGIAAHLPSAIGFLIEKELSALNSLKDPSRPYIVMLGGSKVSDKIGIIEHLAPIADKIMIGGGMAFTFLKAIGKEIGKSLVEEESIEFCKEILTRYPTKICLPVDIHVALELNDTSFSHISSIDTIESKEIGLDIGPETIDLWKKELETVKTVMWNGPLGVYEISKYRTGTSKILEQLASRNAHTVLGGGDIVAAATELGFKEKVSHASTGGGATLELLEGKALPGLEIIDERSES